VTTGKLSPSGSASGQVLKSNGSAVVWGDDQQAGLTLPYAGTTNSGPAAFAVTNSGGGPALFGKADWGAGVYGRTLHDTGSSVEYGRAGVWGDSGDGPGVAGTSLVADGVWGKAYAASASGVAGYSLSSSGGSSGVKGESYGGVGVRGRVTLSSGIAVNGNNMQTGNVGLLGTGDQGVYGEHGTSGAKGSLGSALYGVYGNDFDGSHAGYFNGDVHVNGTLTKNGGSFLIDHPLDPENKTLSHSFVESPDMKNVYDGVVTLDEHGEAVVELPTWFEALNRDFRYQLTAIGGPAPNLYIADEITDNRFRIGGGRVGLKVSWQVTGIRQDAWANAHRIPVERDKPEKERGTYLNPEEWGQSQERSVDWVRTPELMRPTRGELGPTP